MTEVTPSSGTGVARAGSGTVQSTFDWKPRLRVSRFSAAAVHRGVRQNATPGARTGQGLGPMVLDIQGPSKGLHGRSWVRQLMLADVG